jgi:hypothetical protein
MSNMPDAGEYLQKKTLALKKATDSKIYTNAFGIEENGVTIIRQPKEGLDALWNLEEEEKKMNEKKDISDLFRNSPMLSYEQLRTLQEAANNKNYDNS